METGRNFAFLRHCGGKCSFLGTRGAEDAAVLRSGEEAPPSQGRGQGGKPEGWKVAKSGPEVTPCFS